ncbi:MAG: hydrogenobyrinic acid a,c-diamide synthase (glutamine-hydrolyzing) [Methanomassiliicoccaceae archaeon]|nr:hydrogenobyrinic acid a,c-diamide synthase (glutamine-hydrolyzing) [Methanomassiliicoccaceae archaeon]
MPYDIPRIVIAATHSGAGKSTITMGLLMALKKRGLNPQSFKTGPDYLDPMHHTMVIGKECRNLDTWMFGNEVERLFVNGADGSGISVIEGVMGLYDGIDGISEEGSTAHLSKILKAPVVLVIDAKATARSAGAVALGFKEYDKEVDLAGVIFNRVGSQSHLSMLSSSLRGTPALGGVLRNDCMALESRHLGLVPAEEDYDRGKYEKIREHVESCIDIDKLIKIAESAPPMSKEYKKRSASKGKVRIGVARDRAFNFYYIHNIESIAEAGAEIVQFSPLEDELPDVDGLYFGGGYPELFSKGLERNGRMRAAVKKASEDGMPIYAECGGLMYLSKHMDDMESRRHEMCGVFGTESKMSNSKRTLGYVEMTSNTDSVLCRKGWTVRGHEFHYSTTVPTGSEKYAFDLARGHGIEGGKDGMMINNTVAGYTHIHFASNPKIPERFVESCNAFSRAR